jgi:predicted histone-like DNA-binding protein
MLKYKVVGRKNPQTKEKKFYAQLLEVTPITLDSLAQDISNSCTLTLHDIKAVVSALEEHISRALRNGQSVRLRDLGSFYPIIISKGADTPEEFTSNLIESVKVQFRKSSKMQYAFSLNNPEITCHRQALAGEAATGDEEA